MNIFNEDIRRTLMPDTALPDVRTAGEPDNGLLHKVTDSPLSNLEVQTQAHLDKVEAVSNHRHMAEHAILAERLLTTADFSNVSNVGGSGKHRQHH